MCHWRGDDGWGCGGGGGGVRQYWITEDSGYHRNNHVWIMSLIIWIVAIFLL